MLQIIPTAINIMLLYCYILVNICEYFIHCLVSSLSTACTRLHRPKISIAAVMYYKNAQALRAACNDFPLEYLIR